jgi:hypothetical protein
MNKRKNYNYKPGDNKMEKKKQEQAFARGLSEA